MQIKAVTFDVGGTLIEPWPSVGHVYAAVAARHGVQGATAEVLNERFKSAWRSRKDFNYTRDGWAVLVEETFRGIANEPPRATFFDELYDRFTEAEAWRIFEDVLPALDRLATKGLRLAVISNWDERLRLLLRRLELDRWFEQLVISCEVGFAKPSPVIFQEAAAKLGISPGSILHVGDSTELDVAGARAAGFQSLRIERNSHSPGADDLPSLVELPARLGASHVTGR